MQRTMANIIHAVTQPQLLVATYDAVRIGALTYIETLFGSESTQAIYAKSLSSPQHALRDRFTPTAQSEGMKQDLLGLASALATMKVGFDEASAAKNGSQSPADKFDLSRVFVVHGHDLESARRVEGCLKEYSLQPILIMQEPNEGLTIIEKIERYSRVGYAVILMTPDDEGRAVASKEVKRRARQNVVFELGYFIGKLTRSRVAVLYAEGVETPSDISGLAYIPLSDAKWPALLRLELQAAGMVPPDAGSP